MMRSKATIFFAVTLSLLAVASSVMGRDAVREPNFQLPTMTAIPAYCNAAHNVGVINMAVNNMGTLGTGWPAGGSAIDCFTGMPLHSCEYPINSNIEYLFAAALWVGAVVGADTLVSTGADGWSCDGNEFRPDQSPYGDMVYRSVLYPEDPELFEDAVSEQDYIAVYADTFPYVEDGVWLGIQHTPLDIEVTQRSFAWSRSYMDDFVIFNYEIKNIGEQTLNDVYIGMYVDADVGYEWRENYHTDDITGFKDYVTNVYGTCEYEDSINLAWIADNDGDPFLGAFDEHSATGVTGFSSLRLPDPDMGYSFNWWVGNGVSTLDFGPRERPFVGVWPEDYRDFGTGGLGTPEGDRNKYYVLRNREFDYDQIYTASIPADDPIWSYPNPASAGDLSNGYDTRYLFSMGPVDALEPGQSVSFVFAYVAGGNFHTAPSNIVNLPFNPEVYYSNLDFSSISENALYAAAVYDLPGFDTDQDGYSGKFRVCCETPDECDTIWYKGDGVPDYRDPGPYTSMAFWLYPQESGIRVRWNGFWPETLPNVITKEVEFEGYKVFLSTDCSPESYAEVGSYDTEDYRKYYWGQSAWVMEDEVYTLQELRCLYGGSCDDVTFDPLNYTELSPYCSLDSFFYFTKFLDNAYTYGVDTDIRKIYPSQPYPSILDPELAQPEELTSDGYLKYFEYEMDIRGLLPNECYCVYVASFDYYGIQQPLPGETRSLCLNKTDVESESGQPLPRDYVLRQNHPNPFNPVTDISFALPSASQVRLEVFNIVGQKVTTLIDGRLGPGHHTATWDASNQATGIYLYRLTAGGFTAVKKMLLIK